jgi:hypothetical protein
MIHKEIHIKGKANSITGVLGSSLLKSVSHDEALIIRLSSQVTPLIDLDHNPCFFRKRLGSCDLFISGFPVVDIDTPASGPIILKDHLTGYIPFVMFLKFFLKKQIWHNHRTYANLIIDDPHLRRRYGYIHFKELKDETLAIGFNATIAFVPRNYKKTHDSTVELFRESDHLGICIHGFAHTPKEFGNEDFDTLFSKAMLARNLIDMFTKKTGIPSVKCMVFPQGTFSKAALKALKLTNYLAAINSHYISTDVDQNEELTLGNFLTPAVVMRNGFPLFHRRIPTSDPVHFRIAAFLGKPIILVQHHIDFRNGYNQIASCVDELSENIPGIQWVSLESILSKCHWRRINSDNSVSVWLLSRKAQILNKECEPRLFRVSFIEPCSNALDFTIIADGKPIPFIVKDKQVVFDLIVEPVSKKNVCLKYNTPDLKLQRLSCANKISSHIRGFARDIYAAVIPVVRQRQRNSLQEFR